MGKFWPAGLIFLAGCSAGGGTGAASTAAPLNTSGYPQYSAESGLLDHGGPSIESPAHFEGVEENGWRSPAKSALSTFSIDVDTASYSQVRGFLTRRELPPPAAVRVEEMINYFPYDYPPPTNGQPFAVHEELSDCPWDPKSQLLKIGIQGRLQPSDQIPARNLVFLIDVSGSMSGANRLGLVQQGMSRLTQQLGANDHVAIVTYAGSSGVLLAPTSGGQKEIILDALARLESGGSTNGEAGIRDAYELAAKNFDKDGVNRVILATDGDFNVGISDHDQLIGLIEKQRQTGVFLTTLGVGAENINDHMLEQLADKGNGNYAFLDSQAEAEKVLVNEASATLMTIAKDVKIQVEFNPQTIEQYRLLGYENRVLAAEDFNDDSKDAGEVGAGHRVTALYQLHSRQATPRPRVDPLRYRANGNGQEIAQVKVRYQTPQGGQSQLLTQVVTRDQHVSLQRASDDFRFAAAVTQFGLLLRGSRQVGKLTDVADLAGAARGQDTEGYRTQFLEMVRLAEQLQGLQAQR